MRVPLAKGAENQGVQDQSPLWTREKSKRKQVHSRGELRASRGSLSRRVRCLGGFAVSGFAVSGDSLCQGLLSQEFLCLGGVHFLRGFTVSGFSVLGLAHWANERLRLSLPPHRHPPPCLGAMLRFSAWRQISPNVV